MKLAINRLVIHKRIASHLLNPKFSHLHRGIIGFSMMAIGVGIAQLPHELHLCSLCFIGDLLGYLLHGLGGLPIVKWVEALYSEFV